MKPLQTHGQYNEKWIPPKPDRFTIYESSDESWLRPLGFGTIERTLRNLFDVRTGDDMRLVGYCHVDPTHQRDLQLAIIEPAAHRAFFNSTTTITKPASEIITLRSRGYAINHERFLCWCVQLEDVEKLLSTSWLTFGGDNLYEFIDDINREIYERNWRHR